MNENIQNRVKKMTLNQDSDLLMVQSLLAALQTHDAYTYGHCLRVGRYAKLLAQELNLNPFEQRVAEFSGLLHDIGKIGIPEEILLKEDRLNEQQLEIMKSHAEKSVQIISHLRHIPFFNALVPGIRHHHERIDGKGYPNRLLADGIPYMARLVAVVDAYDAMTSERPYRKAKSKEYAYRELTQYSGTQFDQELVQVFLKHHAQWPHYEVSIVTPKGLAAKKQIA